MSYTIADLKDKIIAMYPEVQHHGVDVTLMFDPAKDAYVVKMQRDSHELTTHLERKDADDCMNGVMCVSLGIQVEQFIKNFELREKQ